MKRLDRSQLISDYFCKFVKRCIFVLLSIKIRKFQSSRVTLVADVKVLMARREHISEKDAKCVKDEVRNWKEREIRNLSCRRFLVGVG